MSTADWPGRLFREPLVQPDHRSCGAAVLVVSRVLTDHEYGEQLAAAASVPQMFREEVLATHRRVTRPVLRGRPQIPWPRALGTPPWAVARELGGHEVRWIRTSAASGYDAIRDATRDHHPVPVYVGNRWLPRHVVLALGEVEGSIRCYDPAWGRLVDIDRSAFTRSRLAVAGWDHPWWAILPGRR